MTANGSQICKDVKRETCIELRADHRLGTRYKIGPNQGQTPTGDTVDELYDRITGGFPELSDELSICFGKSAKSIMFYTLVSSYFVAFTVTIANLKNTIIR